LLRRCGLNQGTAEESSHWPGELKLLIAASQEAGLLQKAQREAVERVLNIGNRPISAIMTPRPEVDWIDIDENREVILRTIRECRHDQLLVGRGRRAEPLGMFLKSDLLEQILEGKAPEPTRTIRESLLVHESSSIFKVLEQFKKKPVRVAMVVDEYLMLQGIVTQTDLLEAIAGDLPEVEGEEPDIIERDDGSLLIAGKMSAHEALNRLGVRNPLADRDFHTIAGFVRFQFERLPNVGERFEFEGWRFEIVDMDRRRIDKVLASRVAPQPEAP
jgi:CBS domain containing-hemolysin-like protein